MKFNKFKIYWPYALFGLFAIVIIVNIIYIVIAKETWRGIYTPDAYRKGVEYNKILKNIEEQYKIGIKIHNSITKRATNSFFIETHATDKNGAVMKNLSIIYNFKYLPDANFDMVKYKNDVSFATLDIALPKPGKWQLETVVRYNDKIVQDLAIIEVIYETQEYKESN